MNIYKKYENLALNEFVDIPGFEDNYQINLNGEVKVVERSVYNPLHGEILRKEKIMNKFIINNRYEAVRLSMNGKSFLGRIHRLLALTFIPNPENYQVVRHLDDNPENNSIYNLAWGTQEHNMQDKVKNGNCKGKKGADSPLFGKYGKDHPRYGYSRGKAAGARLVIDTQTGVFYDCLKDAAEAKGHKYGVLKSRMSGRLKNRTGLIYA